MRQGPHRALCSGAGGSAFWALPSVQAAAVHDGLCVPVAAEHHQQIGDHGRFTFVIQLHHFVFAQPVQCHLHHAHGAVHDHLAGVDDGAGLLALEHHCGDLRRIGQIGDAGFHDLNACLSHVFLDLVPDAGRHHLRGAPQAALVGHTVAGGVHIGGYVVGVHPHHVPQGAVTLEGEVLLVVVHIEHRLGSVGDPPDHGDADLHRVAQTIVDLLPGVVQGHHFKRNFLAHAVALGDGLCAAVHVAALAQFGACRRVDSGAEGADPVEARLPQGACIVAEEGEHQRFLRLEHLEAREGDNARNVAEDGDDEQEAGNKAKEKEAFKICQEKIRKHGLEMKLIDAEYTFDNNKVLFYFTADGRIDFRELVKDLASVFRTRIELRQIGVRDETKIRGGIGICGRPLCCHTYLSEFAPVSIKMAKEQNLSLNPTKISGVCGRLMCCLTNEEETYEELNSHLPANGDHVTTPEGLRGDVQSVNVLRQLVKVVVTLDNDEKEIREYPAAELRFKPRRKKKDVRLSKEEMKELKALEEKNGASKLNDD